MQILRPAELTGEHISKIVRFDTHTPDALLPITVTGKVTDIYHSIKETRVFLADPGGQSNASEEYFLHDVKTIEIQ